MPLSSRSRFVTVQFQLVALHIRGKELLDTRGPTAFDLRAILQNRDNSRASSNKMMYEIRDLKDLKLKIGELSEYVMEIVT